MTGRCREDEGRDCSDGFTGRGLSPLPRPLYGVVTEGSNCQDACGVGREAANCEPPSPGASRPRQGEAGEISSDRGWHRGPQIRVRDIRDQLRIEQLIPAAALGERSAPAGERPAGGRGAFTDRELVRFAALHGVVSIGQVMEAFGVGRTAAYRRVAACIEAGLLERLEILREEPSVLRATRAGLRYVGLDLGLCAISAGSLPHQLCCVSAALWLEKTYGSGGVLTERELRFIERAEGRAIYSAKLGERPDGGDLLHRPDLAVVGEGLPVAIEVELSPKAPRRLAAIIRAWRRASWVGGVVYLCKPGPTKRGVIRAVRAARAEERVEVREVRP